MTKRTVGLILFWLAVIWAFGWGIAGSVAIVSTYHSMTAAEVSQSMWNPDGLWFFVWGILGLPLAAVVALVGSLLKRGAKASTAIGLGVFGLVAYFFSMWITSIGHIPPLFGIGGTIILLCFFWILFSLSTKRKDLDGKAASAATLKLVGYTFLVMGTWFTCGMAAFQFLEVFAGEDPGTPLHIMVLFVLGWLFVCLGYWREGKD